VNSEVFFNPIIINEWPGGRASAKFPESSIHPLPARKLAATLSQSPQGFSKKLDGANNRTIEQKLIALRNIITIWRDVDEQRFEIKKVISDRSASC